MLLICCAMEKKKNPIPYTPTDTLHIDGGTFSPQTPAQPNYTLNVRCSLSHPTGQIQCNGVKVLMCYMPLVHILMYYVTANRNVIVYCYLLGSKSTTMLQNPGF
jgi:hypothetical protein